MPEKNSNALDPLDLITGYQFWRDGCRMFTKSLCGTLEAAGEEVTEENVLRFIMSLPRSRSDLTSASWESGFCNRCLKKALIAPEGNKESDVSALDYFLVYFPDRHPVTQAMLIDAFVGVLLGGLDSQR